jgi:hypothetical protein
VVKSSPGFGPLGPCFPPIPTLPYTRSLPSPYHLTTLPPYHLTTLSPSLDINLGRHQQSQPGRYLSFLLSKPSSLLTTINPSIQQTTPPSLRFPLFLRSSSSPRHDQPTFNDSRYEHDTQRFYIKHVIHDLRSHLNYPHSLSLSSLYSITKATATLLSDASVSHLNLSSSSNLFQAFLTITTSLSLSLPLRYRSAIVSKP